MRVNHNPKEGLNNIDTMYKAVGSYHVQVNSIKIKPNVHSKQRNYHKLKKKKAPHEKIMKK